MNTVTFHHHFNYTWDENADVVSPKKEAYDWMTSNPNGDVHIFDDESLPTHEKFPCKHKIAWIMEMPAIYNHCRKFNSSITDPFAWLEENHRHFRYIMSPFMRLKTLVGEDRFLYVPAAVGRIQRKDIGVYEKSKMISIIASFKNWTVGHRLRHQIIARIPKMDIYGNGYNDFIDKNGKIYALAPYYFTIVILNCIEDDAFSEAFTDPLSTGTIPVYWGTRGVDKYFNKEGIIHFETIEDLEKLIPTLTPELYNSKLNAVVDNMNRSKDYVTHIDWAYEKYKSLLETL